MQVWAPLTYSTIAEVGKPAIHFCMTEQNREDFDWSLAKSFLAVLDAGSLMGAARRLKAQQPTLSRHIAERGRFPAVDVLKSISRLQTLLQGPREKAVASKARKLIALYSNMEELVRIGAYVKGADAEVDEAVRLWPLIEAFLQQDVHQVTTPDDAIAALEAILMPPAPVAASPSGRRAVK